jgi:hypothetical protein
MKNVAIITRSAGKENEISEKDFRDLDRMLAGRIVLPFDESYGPATEVWNGLVKTEPAVIAVCLNENDVLSSLQFARDFDMSVSVKGGGHSVAGKGLLESGMVLDLLEMKQVTLDEKRRRITVGGGTTFDVINPVTERFGLTVPSGFVSMMGVGGMSLHGGLGPLMRKYGLTCDSIDSLRLACADGKILEISSRENRELFWALRGGSETLGVITDITFNLHEIEAKVARIYVAYPISSWRRVLNRVEEYMRSAPPDVGLNVHYGTVSSRAAIIIYGLYLGSSGDESRIIDPLRNIETPLFDHTERVRYSEAQTTLSSAYPGGGRYYWRSLFIDHFSDEVLEVMAAYAQNRTSPQSKLAIWTLGGKVRSFDSDSSAVPFRKATFMIAIEANWIDKTRDAENIQWGRDAWNDLYKYSSGSVYLNFAGIGHEPKDAALHIPGIDQDRLSRVKRRHDPNNMFK